MGGCNKCVRYRYSYGKQPEGYIQMTNGEDTCLGIKYGMCEAGNNDEMKKWWDLNGKLPVDKASEMKCHQNTVIDNCLDMISEIVDNMKK